MMYLFGAWTIGCVGLGWWVGRRSKWEEVKDVKPTLGVGETFSGMADPVDKVIQDRMMPHGLEND